MNTRARHRLGNYNMARNTEAAPNIHTLWKKRLLSVYMAFLSFLSLGPETVKLVTCIINANGFKARSSWLESTFLPNDCYLSPLVNRLFQPLFVLAVLMATLSPMCTVAFMYMVLRRARAYTMAILIIAMNTIIIVAAAVELALQTLALKSSLDMQVILTIRPDLSSEDILRAWNGFMGRRDPRVIFATALVAGGFQIVVVSFRHVIPSPWRLPKQLHLFVMKKHKSKSAIGEPKASTLGTELVAGVDSGPLAKLFDDYERRGLIPTHTDFEVCQVIWSLFVHAYAVSQSFGSANLTRPMADEERDAFFTLLPFPLSQEVNTLFNTLIKDVR